VKLSLEGAKRELIIEESSAFHEKVQNISEPKKIVKMMILGSSPTISININSKVQIFHILTSFYEGVQNVEKFLLQTPIFFAVRRDKEVCFLHRRC